MPRGNLDTRLVGRNKVRVLVVFPLDDSNIGNRQHRPNVIGLLARRQKSLAISEEAKKIAWKAQQRLHKRYRAMSARGKNKNQIVTAIGRELLGFIWAIAMVTEKQQKLANAA